MKGHEPYAELGSDHDEEQILKRFASGQFSEIDCSLMSQITHKCWAGKYNSVDEVLQDLEFVRVRWLGVWGLQK